MTRLSPYDLLFRGVLTRTDAEWVHAQAFRAIRLATPVTRWLPRAGSPVQRMGLDFPGVLGLAAGFDKNAEAVDGLAALGFGCVEVGTVTGEPQPGNPRPRLARLPADGAIVNRMGFNNHGAEVVAARLAERERRGGRVGVPLGVNIGRTKVVPDELAVADYEKSTTLLAPYADYLVVNVSSPNTPGLRDLQSTARLEPLLAAVRRRADDVLDRHLPLLVKIAPDLADDDVVDVAAMATRLGLDGIVATNTTVGRAGLSTPAAQVEEAGGGGLSGAPLRDRATDVLRLLRAAVPPSTTLVGVGGIGTAEDARARLDAGADLLQAYTGFVYGGPRWPARLNDALAGHRPRAGERSPA